MLRGGFKNRGLESYYASWTDVGGVGPGNRGRSRDGVLAGSFTKGVSYYPIVSSCIPHFKSMTYYGKAILIECERRNNSENLMELVLQFAESVPEVQKAFRRLGEGGAGTKQLCLTACHRQ